VMVISVSSHGPVTHKQNVSIQIAISVNLNKFKRNHHNIPKAF